MQKRFNTRPQPSGEYFLMYDTCGFGAVKRRFLREAMDSVRDRIGDVLRRPDPIRFAMFGSATVRNLDDAADFLGQARPHQIMNDRITVVERDADRLAKHRQFAEDRGMMDVELVPGDMNALVLPEGSVDLLLIDYTMAFNVALTETAALDARATDGLYHATLRSAAQALAPHGAAVLNVNLHPGTADGDYLLRHEAMLGVYSTAVRESRLHELLTGVGLEAGNGLEIQDNYWQPAKRMILRHNAESAQSAA